jgi:demethylmenaquinone methyltransferase/2-methoxy-6-polyprenyl-1,4-benzoquinol methylase
MSLGEHKVELTIGTWRISVRRLLPTTLDLTRLYNASAWYWDSPLHTIPFGHAYVQLFKRLVSDGWLSEMGDPWRVLDCGIGTGLFSDALLRTVRRRFEICGVDLSATMLARARSRLMRRGVLPRLESGDAHSLPFCSDEMDLVISALMLEHVPAPLEALREMTRVARPGATLVLVVTRPHAPDLPFRVRYRYKPLPPEQLMEWMTEAAIRDIRPCPLAGIARLFGLAYVGRNSK